MDAVQTIVKNKLGLTGHQVWAYKEMYDFIGRFSFCQSKENDLYSKELKLSDIKLEHNGGRYPIPSRTRQIIDKIGSDKLWMYFSPYAYEKKFENFCKKMREEKAQMSDYYAPGLLVIEKIEVIESTYGE